MAKALWGTIRISVLTKHNSIRRHSWLSSMRWQNTMHPRQPVAPFALCKHGFTNCPPAAYVAQTTSFELFLVDLQLRHDLREPVSLYQVLLQIL